MTDEEILSGIQTNIYLLDHNIIPDFIFIDRVKRLLK